MARSPYHIERVSGIPVTDEELLTDLRSVAVSLGKKTVGQKEYRRFGKYDDSTASNRFGSWNKALLAAGLTVSNEVNISDHRLFDNLLVLWEHYGRQPRRAELARAPSTISQGPYSRRFGSGQPRWQPSSSMRTAVGATHPWRKMLQSIVARADESRRYGFVGAYYRETGSRAERAVQVRPSVLKSSFTLTTSCHGAKAG